MGRRFALVCLLFSLLYSFPPAMSRLARQVQFPEVWQKSEHARRLHLSLRASL